MRPARHLLVPMALAVCCTGVARARAGLPQPLPPTFPAAAAAEDSILQHAVDDLALRADLLAKDAQTDVRVVNVAAHPDDEDGQTLTLLRQEYGYQTHILYMTRGEGGQNEIGPALGDELARLRSLECQEAAAGYGATISFLNCPDFGYSKSANETLARWGEQATLSRLVEELRLLDADIVITHHTPGEGHGHHRATSILLRRACRELQRRHDPAAPAALLELTADPDSATVSADASGAAPGLPWSYAGRAHVALRRHVSQGMGLDPIPDGTAIKRYRAVEGVGLAGDLRRWARAQDPWAALAVRRLIGRRPPRDARSLMGAAARLRSGDWLQLESAFVDPDPHRPIVPEHEPPWVELTMIRLRGPGANLVESCWSLDERAGGFRIASVGMGKPNALRVAAVPPTWRSLSPAAYLRTRRCVADSLELGLVFQDDHVEVRRVPLPACLRPVLEFPTPLPYAVPGREGRLRLRRSGFDHLAEAWFAEVQPDDPRLARSAQPVEAWRADGFPAVGVHAETAELVFTVPPTAGGTFELALTGAGNRERTFKVGLPVVEPVLPTALRVGCVAGADSVLGHQLAGCGVPLSWVGSEGAAGRDLDACSTLVLDARSYALHPWLRAADSRLLDWVRAGGHLVVLMHKSFDWQPDDSTASDLPPLPLHVGRARVCEEDAPVTLLAPQHPLFHFPHELDASTWAGWHQERGLYFPDAWDPAFTPLVRMNDAGEPPLDGGILCARVGKGAYTYTCLAWGRQLRQAHPGALRAFINLLSWPLAPRSD